MPSRYWTGVKLVLENLFSLQKAQWATWDAREEGRSHDERSLALLTKATISRWRWSEINEAKLTALLEAEQSIKFSNERLILYLPPFPKEEREFVPVVSLEYYPNIECLRMRVGMYRLDDNGRPCGFGFRLESPTSSCSGEENESIHDFYHIQLITTLEDNAPPLGLPNWLPERQPAISIRAKNPVDAMLNLILSLYGLDFYKDFLKSVKGRLNIELMPLPR